MIQNALSLGLYRSLRVIRSKFEAANARLGEWAKRALDVFAASIGLLFLSPLLVLVAAVVRWDSPGPVFYRGPRVGRSGKPFSILKFRTMYESPESYRGPHVTAKGDPRVTRFGRWLRSTKINELPQLWNVLVGEMSLVGPRPETPSVVEALPREVRDEILSVRPGVTSPASVLYHSEEELLAQSNLMPGYFRNILPDKMRLDQLYVRHRSFISDLDVIFWTVAILVPRIAGGKIPEGYIFAGPLSRLMRRHVSWFALDLLTALAAAGLVCVVWRSQHPLDWGFENLAVLAVLIAFLFSALNAIAGLNRILWEYATVEDAIGLVFSSGFATALIYTLNHLQGIHSYLPYPSLPPAMILTMGLLTQFGFVAMRYRLRLLTGLADRWVSKRPSLLGVKERVLIVGEGEGCQVANWMLNRGMFRHAFSVVGMVSSDDPTKHGMRIQGCAVLGGIGDIPALIERHDVRVILYATPGSAAETRNIVFNISEDLNIRLVFLDDLLTLIDRQSDQLATASEYSEWLQERTDAMSLYDAVTGLPGRNLLQDRLRHSILYSKRYKSKPAVVFVELIKHESQTGAAGEGTENELLKAVAKRLVIFKRESDTLGRYREHEFGLILENVPDLPMANAIAKRLVNVMSQPFKINGHVLFIKADIGVSLCTNNEEEEGMPKPYDIEMCHATRAIIAQPGFRWDPDAGADGLAEVR
jgi:diguanylate cyclase (GGDEF)-like protein